MVVERLRVLWGFGGSGCYGTIEVWVCRASGSTAPGSDHREYGLYY